MAEIRTHPSSSQWSELPADILGAISDRLDDTGNLRLRSVCSNWRSAVPLLNPTFEVPFKSPFPVFDQFSSSSNFSISRNTLYFLRSVASPWWLLRVEGKGSFGKFRPLNPFFRSYTEEDGYIPKGFPAEINLLDVQICEIGRAYHLNLRNSNHNRCSSKVVVSSDKWMRNPSDEEGDYAILVLFMKRLGFISSTDENWVEIDDPNWPSYDSYDASDYHDIHYDSTYKFDDILYSKEKDVFYAVNTRGRLIMIGRDFEPKVFISERVPLKYRVNSYLVESNGELLFVVKQYDESLYENSSFFLSYDIGGDLPYRFKVYKLNEEKKIWDPVTSLGDLVIFVGYDFSYAVSAQQFGLEANCIYFKDDDLLGEYENELYVGIFCMKSESCKIFLKSPAWIKPQKTKTASEFACFICSQ